MMKRFLLAAPEELWDRIESWRGDRRLKHTADAVRQLIERGLGDGVAMGSGIKTAVSLSDETLRIENDSYVGSDVIKPLPALPQDAAFAAAVQKAEALIDENYKFVGTLDPTAAKHAAPKVKAAAAVSDKPAMSIPFGPVKRATPKGGKKR